MTGCPGAPPAGVTDLVRDRSAVGLTWTVALAELSTGSVSGRPELIRVAVLVRVPTAVAVADTVRVALAPAARDGTVHRPAAPSQVPAEPVAEPITRPSPAVSAMTTSVWSAGPWLVTVTTNPAGSP